MVSSMDVANRPKVQLLRVTPQQSRLAGCLTSSWMAALSAQLVSPAEEYPAGVPFSFRGHMDV